jgi:eukaryotic-like serine/threonine-protein kinase
MNGDRWALIEARFDAALALPPEQRRAFLAGITDPALRDEVASLLRANDSAAGFLEQPAQTREAPVTASVSGGSRIGAWRVVRLIGRGGMGEVYEVARADGQFEQRAALKLTRLESAGLPNRFNAERQILARLDHPGIARLLDGGVTDGGRPYAVMEYVEGESLLQYLDTIGAGLKQRLEVFLQVCDSVSYAHQNLIVHRDIKPGNILVGRDGRTRLLDFGIAKPLDTSVWPDGDGAQTKTVMLTPDYAAPEQLSGEPVTTATDVYALGVLLFELLTGRRPFTSGGQSLGEVMRRMREETAPKASALAKAVGSSPVAPRALEGDLDAIIARCLRREPQDRYSTVNELRADIERSVRSEPVLAREHARWYVFGRFLRRYRWGAAAVATVIATLGIGIVTTTWQANRASREATRAAATRDFLVSVFRESDPTIARDRVAGELTAKELLDRSVERVETEFVADPQTQLELLGVASEIYGYWLDEPRFQKLLDRRVQIARRHFGPTHPVIIDSTILNAWGSIYTQDFATANRLLAEADGLIAAGRHEGSLLRAQWWLAKAEALRSSDPRERVDALGKAVDLYARLAPVDANYAIALANVAVSHLARENYQEARANTEAAIEVFTKSRNRSDIDLAATYANLGRSLQALGEFDAAERAYEQNASLVRRTLGERHGAYWSQRAEHARLVHMRGERERAHRMFDGLFALMDGWVTNNHPFIVREYYGERLAAEGRAQEAVPLLEAAERVQIERPGREFDLRRIRQTLGDAYDRVGRYDDARRALSSARDERMQKDAADSIAVLGARERWARFLHARGQGDAAVAELREITRIGAGKNIAPIALAHGDLALAALARHDPVTALQESNAALKTLDAITGLYDVRLGPQLWRIHAQALASNGDAAGAARWNAQAAAASVRYDAPSSR